jgi:hypothetical protein
MSRIKYPEATSQVVLQVFDFSTNLRSVFIEYRNRLGRNRVYSGVCVCQG